MMGRTPVNTNKDVRKMPFLVWLVLICTVTAFFGGVQVLGYKLSGISWVVPFACALLLLARHSTRAAFPARFWLPWVLLLLTSLLLVDWSRLDSSVSPVQRTMQLLSPLAVGMAVSLSRPSTVQLARFICLCRYLAILLLGIVAFKLSNIFFSARFSEYSGMAAEMMTVVLLCSLLANRYLLYQERRDLLLWCALLVVPVINVTRTAIAATLLTFPLSCAPMKISRRFVSVLLIVLLAVGIFYSPRVQKKMFYSGQGRLSEVLSDDIDTSGRSYIWNWFWKEGQEELLLGHGLGSGETLTLRITGKTRYPHNDWLLIFYDHGLLGLGAFTFAVLLAMRHSLRAARLCLQAETRLLLFTGASAFVMFLLIMVTDNIMVYASYFGNLHFMMLGLAYGALRNERKTALES